MGDDSFSYRDSLTLGEMRTLLPECPLLFVQIEKDAFLQAVALSVVAKICAPEKLATLSKSLNRHRTRISVRFKATIKVELRHFRQMARFAKGRALILRGGWSCNDISQYFSVSLSTVENDFKRFTGMAAKQYARACKDGNPPELKLDSNGLERPGAHRPRT